MLTVAATENMLVCLHSRAVRWRGPAEEDISSHSSSPVGRSDSGPAGCCTGWTSFPLHKTQVSCLSSFFVHLCFKRTFCDWYLGKRFHPLHLHSSPRCFASSSAPPPPWGRRQETPHTWTWKRHVYTCVTSERFVGTIRRRDSLNRFENGETTSMRNFIVPAGETV